tara:strand:+ start:44755 stop:45642 length:888 start_codon:yes stop_codon:yes gene_type:complete
MTKEIKRFVEVEQEDGTTTKIYVKRPSSRTLTEAQRIYSQVWTDCVRDKIMTKQELQNFMYEQNIWNAQKDIKQVSLSANIQSLEKKLYVGNKGQKTMKASEAKKIAIEMRIERAKLRDLISEKMALEQNTAEALADNARFDVIVAKSTFYENGDRVYNNLEDYNENADSATAYAAATGLAELMYSLDKDFEKNLPENQFLSNQGFVNDDLSLVNRDGDTVDTEGRRINDLGYYINDEGQRTDIEGNLLDDNGNYIPSVKYVEDEEEAPTPKKKTVAKKKATKTKKSEASTSSGS